MIEVIYDGNLGNNLFQYCFGGILAQRLGYRLVADPIPGFPGTAVAVPGAEYPQAPVLTLRGQRPDLGFLQEARPEYRVLLTGYFQRSEYYAGHAASIRNWLAVPPLPGNDIGPGDVVLGIRRGRDYIPRHGLPISYYEAALARVSHERVFICTNEPDDPFIDHFRRKYRAVVRPPGALDNLQFIKRFDKIVISNSTFLWWAAFLSDAREIVFPRPANGFWSAADPLSRNIALEVDEPRYTYLECERYQSAFASERLRNRADALAGALRSAARALLPPGMRRRPPEPRFVFSEPAED